MKLLISLLLALLLVFFSTTILVADDEEPGKDNDDDGGSAFDEPDEEKPEEEAKPFPAKYSFKDYKLEMSTEDGRFWKQDLNFTEDELNKYNIVLKLAFKLPKSESFFDVRINGRGFSHKSGFDFDGLKVSASNYSKLADVFYEKAIKSWKDVKDPEKPKTTRIFRKIKAIRYALTGTPEGWSMPIHQECYFFKFKDKTYWLTIDFSTTAARTERITKEVQNLLKTLKERKRSRR